MIKLFVYSLTVNSLCKRGAFPIKEKKKYYVKVNVIIIKTLSYFTNHSIFVNYREHLLETYGEYTVRLSSANTYSYAKKDMTFRQYCNKHLFPQNRNTLGNGKQL